MPSLPAIALEPVAELCRHNHVSRQAGQPGGARVAVPVDDKKGAPREGEDEARMWDADRRRVEVNG